MLAMTEKYQHLWCDALPWVLLGRHAAYQPDLGASPAGLVLGTCPKLPGDLVRDGDPASADVSELVKALQMNDDRPPVQTAHHRQVPVYWPESAEKATHVWLRQGKTSTLGPNFKGPYPIDARLGDSCLRLRKGHYVSGEPKLQTVHWNNCKPAVVLPDSNELEHPSSEP